MATEMHKETLGFQAEVNQLLDLMIHSLYSNKEIFLRELISNASDAVDKLRFEVLSHPELGEDDSDYKIRVSYDKPARTITISDNGIGMNRDEVINNIGTIAKSGTQEFFKSLTGDQRKDANLIGQFGVGFYSSFVVSDRVTLTTRRAGTPVSDGVRWESEGKGDYTLENLDVPQRGTSVTLHLREGEDELLSGYKLRQIIRKYSDHISLPIVMKKEGGPDTPDEDEVVNQASALWTRSKSEISEEDYKEFYKHVSHDFSDPLAYVHSRMEGKYEYTLLLYIPSQAPFDLWNRDQRHGVKLYVRRVFIMDDAEQLMPTYLRFVRGLIDSSDLPLNVSREILQHNRIVESIKTGAVKKVLGLLSDLANNEKEKYTTFWKEFGKVLKEGVVEDNANQEAVAKLLRFSSTLTSSEVQDVSLEDYISRMKEGQDKIYYITADSFAAAKNSPLLEIFKARDIEVLLLSDPVDMWLVSNPFEFKSFHLQSVSKGEVDLAGMKNEEQKEEAEKAATEFKSLVGRMKTVLGGKVQDVRVTSRLTSSPTCLVADEHDLDPNLRRLLESAGQQLPSSKPIFEINPQPPVLVNLKDVQDEKNFAGWVEVLFDQAVLSNGEKLDDPINFVNKLNDLLISLGSR
ncbi:MAG TPA: molecular chaperone HtpG [Ktedonobacteraceae bacterium]|nr:molecular chaperone HtpG [Ktedonobacteraceae bacterium]